MKKVMSGLKFKFEPHDKVWGRVFDERWVCDLGYFRIEAAVFTGQNGLHGPQATVWCGKGHHRMEGATLEEAVEAVIAKYNIPEERKYSDWDSTWPRALEDARKGRLNIKQRTALKQALGTIIFFLAISLFTVIYAKAEANVPSTPKTCQCPCP